ncbi:MAG TPA: nucleotidyl transferase AbiEii/AbiGii toxin family protein [Desulfomonilaceae bacterium]|nr:nucleotidyl transferase AbiEii/AbiGii toxin family protein [Desulfomonilaceae bacterium]
MGGDFVIVSKQTLLDEAAAAGFRAEILEKVFYLLALLTGISKHPFLKERVVLTGGTALNLFMFDLPRLSVDIDLNYIGSVDPDKMKAERPRLLKAIAAVCKREGLAIDHVKDDRHAATKFLLRYTSPLGRGGNLKIDLLYMYRIALWPITKRKSVQIGTQSQIDFPVQDIHELAGGKLKALLSRKASRDLFDAHLLFNEGDLEQDKLRLAFVVYGAMAMSDKDWREIKTTDVDFTKEDLDDQLIPVLRRKNLKDLGDREEWARKLVNETRESLNRLLPLTSPEKEFLDRLFDHGEIEPRILTQDEEMVERISQHPNLKWQAQKVEKYKLKK